MAKSLEEAKQEALDKINALYSKAINPYDLSDAEMAYWTIEDCRELIHEVQTERGLRHVMKIFNRYSYMVRKKMPV